MHPAHYRVSKCFWRQRHRFHSSYAPPAAWKRVPLGTPYRRLQQREPNNKPGDHFGPLWPPNPEEEHAGTAAIAEGFSPAGPKPVRGTLCAGDYMVTRRLPEAMRGSPSRFPYDDRFVVAGEACTSREIIDALSGQLYPDRLERIQQVAADRCTSILPVVEGLVDRGNVGALCRSADALGFGAVHCIETGTAERVKPARGNRTSKGAEKWLDVQEHRGTGAAIAHLRAAGYQVLVSRLGPDALPVTAVDFTRPTAFIMGNELNGPSEEAVALADGTLCVAQAACFTESLNVSIAAAIILHEARQQRGRALGRCGNLSPEEQRVLTAMMLLKQRSSRAVAWHPHWRHAGVQDLHTGGQDASHAHGALRC